MTTDCNSEKRLLDWSDVAKRVPLSRSTIWNMRRIGAFPEPTRISVRRIAWREDQINAWIESRECGQRAGSAV